MKERLLRILLVTGCLYATACTLNRETVVPDPDVEREEVAVSFLLSAEDRMVSTRAGDDKKRTISDGHLIDKVVYAVYVKVYDNDALDDSGKPTWTGEFRLLDQYGDGSVGLGTGQAKLPSTEKLQTPEGESLVLRLMRGQEYVIGFWAQNSDCEAYNSRDLEKVVVDYNASNNDEMRDAFCQVCTFTAQVGVTEKVVLKRAMAQVNIGTAGWDYIDEVAFGNSYAYSKIQMTGLNNRLNVLTGDVSKTDDFKGEVTYDWAVLPAYIEEGKAAEYPSDIEQNKEQFAEWLKSAENDKEFLYVKLVDKPDYLPYLTTTPADKTTEITTEVFKYLSMCYVLAPTVTDAEETNDGLTIDELTFWLAEFVKDGKGYVYDDADKTIESTAPRRFTIPNVPVQRNWRTNILGGVRGNDDSLFDPREWSLWIDLSPSYDGDHYHYDGGNGNTYGDTECDDWTE